jgi:polar amino acid transport system substrate-binding protein
VYSSGGIKMIKTMSFNAHINKAHLLWLLLCTFFVFGFNHAFAKTYTLAMEVSPPFSSLDSNKHAQGLAIDLVEAMVELGGNKLEPIVCPFARCLRLVEKGDADFIFGIVKTSERSKFLKYIEPAFITTFTDISFFQLNSSTLQITTMKDVEQLIVGIQRGAKHFDDFDNNHSINKINVPNISTLIEMLKKGRIDTFVMPKKSAEQYLKKHDQDKKIKQANFTINNEQRGYIAISKKSKHIQDLSKLNSALQQLKDSGKLKKILKQYQLN